MNFNFDGRQGVAAPAQLRPITPRLTPQPNVGRGWIGPISAPQNASASFANIQGSGKIPAGVGTAIRDGSFPVWWKTFSSAQGTVGQLTVEFQDQRRALYYFLWTGYVGAQMPVGVGTYADVNPKCTSNAQFSGDYHGDYWTGYGSEDNEAQAYNANWLWNILQIGVAGCGGSGCGGGDRQHGDGRPGCPGGGGCKGCSCGCDRCRHYAWTSQMRAVMDAQGLGHHPACASVGVGHVEIVDVPDQITVAIVERGPVKQNPCDTRWQNADYPPTEGPTDADTRCADAWWIGQVTTGGCGSQQGVGSMEGISYGGRPAQGFGAVRFLPEAPPTVPVGVLPHPGGGGPDVNYYSPYARRVVGGGRQLLPEAPPTVPVGVLPHPGGGGPDVNYSHRVCPPGTVWNTYRRTCTNPTQLRADMIAAARVPVDSGLAAPPAQGLGATVTNPSATAPATVGVVAALGGTVGLLVGAAVGSEIGTGYGEVATRRAAVGGLLGMLVGTFTGAAIVAPSIQAQQGA
jgi:hypothetical protein